MQVEKIFVGKQFTEADFFYIVRLTSLEIYLDLKVTFRLSDLSLLPAICKKFTNISFPSLNFENN